MFISSLEIHIILIKIFSYKCIFLKYLHLNKCKKCGKRYSKKIISSTYLWERLHKTYKPELAPFEKILGILFLRSWKDWLSIENLLPEKWWTISDQWSQPAFFYKYLQYLWQMNLLLEIINILLGKKLFNTFIVRSEHYFFSEKTFFV